jgi:hypothetical protein
VFNHGMWPWSHCTDVVVPAAFAGHQGQRRSSTQGSDRSERYSRSPPRAGVLMHVDSLTAYAGRSFEHAAKVVSKDGEENQTRIDTRKRGTLPGALNRTGINEFAYQVRVFGFLEHGDRTRILQYVVLNQCTRCVLCVQQHRCALNSAARKSRRWSASPECCSLSSMARSRSQWWNNRAPIFPPNGCCNWAACCAAAPGTAVIWALPGV